MYKEKPIKFDFIVENVLDTSNNMIICMQRYIKSKQIYSRFRKTIKKCVLIIFSIILFLIYIIYTYYIYFLFKLKLTYNMNDFLFLSIEKYNNCTSSTRLYVIFIDM